MAILVAVVAFAGFVSVGIDAEVPDSDWDEAYSQVEAVDSDQAAGAVAEEPAAVPEQATAEQSAVVPVPEETPAIAEESSEIVLAPSAGTSEQLPAAKEEVTEEVLTDSVLF